MSALRDSLRGDQMASLAAVKKMTLEQKQACMLYLPCSKHKNHGDAKKTTCHRVRDLVHDRGRGVRFYKQCAAAVVSNARTDAAKSALKRELSRAASLLFPSLKGVERYTDAQLHFLVALFMRRAEVAMLWAQGSCSLTYWFF